jgi:DNA-binding NarL/FixJ family response regulator
MPKLLIVEDDITTRDGLARLLTRHGYEVETAGDGTRALLQASRCRFDVVLLDLNLPGIPGLELIRRLRRHDPTLPMVVLTGEGSVSNALAALRHGGAFDFLKKPVTDMAELQRAIAAAYAHGCFLREAGEPRDASPSEPGPARPALSEREYALLRLVAEGHPNHRIATETCLSPKTVRNYLSALYDKLGVTNRTQAAMLYRAWEAGS